MHALSATSWAVVLDTIVDNSLDFFAVVETWHDTAESTNVIAATPPGCRVFERARPMSAAKAASFATNHGGICVFARSSVQVSVLDLPTYKSFELLPLNVRHGTLSFALVVIYRWQSYTEILIDNLTWLILILSQHLIQLTG